MYLFHIGVFAYYGAYLCVYYSVFVQLKCTAVRMYCHTKVHLYGVLQIWAYEFAGILQACSSYYMPSMEYSIYCTRPKGAN